MLELLRLFQKKNSVLSKERKSQIVATIGTLLHDIHVEFQIKTPCLLFMVLFRAKTKSFRNNMQDKPSQDTNLGTVIS